MIRYSKVYGFVAKYRSILNTGRQICTSTFLAHTHQCVQFHQSWCVLLIDALHVRSRLCLLFLFVDSYYFIDSYKLCGAHFLLRLEGMRCPLKPCTTKPFAIAIAIVVFILSIVYCLCGIFFSICLNFFLS